MTLDFNFERKRMSVIVEDENNVITLFCKGADSVMLDLADFAQTEIKVRQTIECNLLNYSENGLRTLVFGKKVLNKEDFLIWKNKYEQALQNKI